jgi:hypothetical protein
MGGLGLQVLTGSDEPSRGFFSDGGTDIREVQLYLNPEADALGKIYA